MIQGNWYPKDSSAEYAAELFLEGKKFIFYHENEPLQQGDAELLVFSDRIGNIPRKITLPDGSLFSTKDNDAIDAWLSISRHKAFRANYLFLLESRWRWVVTSLVVTIAFVFVTIFWGLPWTSKKAAYIIPSEASQVLSDNTLKLLDKILFEPSNLSAEQQLDLTQHFVEKLLPADSNDFSYTLHFRHMPSSSSDDSSDDGAANAFALPSGVVVVTDGLVNMVNNQEELDAILLHEIGHVVHRHSLRQLLQSSALTLVLIMITGDASVIEEWTLALPAFLLETNYSREFESEADRYAFQRMTELGIDPLHFAHILARITLDASSDDKKADAEQENMLRYLSSHPPSPERIEQAKLFSEHFRQLRQLRQLRQRKD
ncbi:MAG: M48 family metalloprotease [Gammaproteobacteria bacterium]|nr:M48 family metalloprotease [Gammaproteobacteria bacterium]